ncbi:PhzA/PhzB family protein [Noviherbaspirillum sp. CPCC 100848]|uniref:PhzA/PhzB family protein n=1 Tax=Noviherbaspirillum album TaxID=3080276 RepID=A0ABU6JGK4_9BURK|nr:nuclear transport factor 2 family protein [Noviherbaspirillum sp. CPCC 100848]MEC4722668.1 PhzA/PhzB family protein [Noviherbaspirillum sp. CPCC 100848]
MTIASELLEQHLNTLVMDNARWKTLITDDIVWELPYAGAIGHPEKLEGRGAVETHVGWFLKAVSDFRFYDLRIMPGADPETAVAQVKAEGIINDTGHVYRQEYIVFLKASNGRIAVLREYFDPVRAAHALGTPILNTLPRE